MTTTTIDRAALTSEAMTQLHTVTNASVWLGEPNLPLPLVPGSDGRVKPYVILWPSPGTPADERDVADTAVDLDWTIQLTCAAGTLDDLQGLVSRVDAAFYRWQPVIDGLVCGPFKPPPGFDPGPARLDRDFTPHRPYVPLQYRTTVTAT